ncbi:hypothetical protein DBT48_00220 [Aerococcus mictus]|uniref:Uncharacterized protein n=1 Tax=Aerococcus urinae TaxID=1376 RepID=A0A329NZL4_9LACT|nr:hypothetical protein DBT47_01760 [Aerococcus mictus]RAV77525.1 hypothetical protein DBT54_08690 [Aerococcus loyolae]RAV75617.1 hypothetical protein DBT48_00220 [Aerococcus mictus]RAV78261.1 hypothetical protein DBT52_08955 [Aerococcus mictus]RAV86705.1 hypothetical protein DBT36_03240 [Aerococcus mictus]
MLESKNKSEERSESDASTNDMIAHEKKAIQIQHLLTVHRMMLILVQIGHLVLRKNHCKVNKIMTKMIN